LPALNYEYLFSLCCEQSLNQLLLMFVWCFSADSSTSPPLCAFPIRGWIGFETRPLSFSSPKWLSLVLFCRAHVVLPFCSNLRKYPEFSPPSRAPQLPKGINYEHNPFSFNFSGGPTLGGLRVIRNFLFPLAVSHLITSLLRWLQW